ncbi:MAG: CapA family protein [Microcoleaceae cyanobacterium]
MVYAETLAQPSSISSLLELARTGDFRAIGHLLNRYLRPQGISARVAANRKGCLQVLVEFHQEPAAERIIQFICHLLWEVNAPTVEGVKIAGRFRGQPNILWKQSVRLLTPTQRTQQSFYHRFLDKLQFKTLRTLMMVGSSVMTFVLGCWVSYAAISVPSAQIPVQAEPEAIISTPPPKRSNQIQAALESVPVIQHTAVQKPQDPTVTLMFGGDVTLSNSFEETVGKDYPWAFQKLQEYRDADLAMVNLENPLTRSTLRRPNKQFNFKAAPEAVQVLKEGGIDIVNLANNHAMDYEEPGLVETLKTLEKAGIHAVGAGREITEARRPEIIEVKGQRIAYFGYYDADFHAAEAGIAGTNPRHNNRIAEDIKAVRDQVDWVIVNFHWGVELAEYPGDWQIELARFTVDQGADLVVGHHPHVLQGAEVYRGRPIIYSLGNFIFGGNRRSNYDTAVLKVALRADHQMKVEFLPIEVRQYQAAVAQGKQGDEILQRIEKLSRIFDQPMQSPVVLNSPQIPAKSVTGESPTLEAQPSQDQQSTAPFQVRSPLSGSQILLTDPATSQVPPPNQSGQTQPQQPQSEAEVLKPYIQEPFIVDPFVPLPHPQQQSKLTPQGYNNDNSPISFTLSLPRFGSRPQRQSLTKERLNLDSKGFKPLNRVELPF